jgi:CheY-like chemotaxis protein
MARVTEYAALDEDIEFEDAPPQEEPLRKRVTARALVVEDDPDSARICSDGLERLGLDTEVVWTPEAAIEALGATGGDLAIVFVDRSLRGGAGRRVAEEARRLHPASTIVEADTSLADVLFSDGVVLAKPFTEAEFQSALDAALFEGPVVPTPVYELPEIDDAADLCFSDGDED